MSDVEKSEVLQVLMDPVMEDFSKFASLEDDAVFEHAVALGHLLDVNVGSPEFDEVYRRVMSAHGDAMRWSYYLASVSLATVKVLLESGDLELRVPVGTVDEMAEHLSSAISKATLALLSALLHVAAGPDEFWVDNTALASVDRDTRSIYFEFEQIGVSGGDA